MTSSRTSNPVNRIQYFCPVLPFGIFVGRLRSSTSSAVLIQIPCSCCHLSSPRSIASPHGARRRRQPEAHFLMPGANVSVHTDSLFSLLSLPSVPFPRGLILTALNQNCQYLLRSQPRQRHSHTSTRDGPSTTTGGY